MIKADPLNFFFHFKIKFQASLMKDYKTKSNESPVVKHLLSIHKFDISMNIFFLYIFILYGIFV